MEELKTNSGQALGTAALITGIITFVIAIIPCVGIIAIVPGIVTIVLAAIGLSQAARDNSPRGMTVAALVIGIIALLISTSQIFAGSRIARHADKLPVELREALKEVKDIKGDILKDLEDANINIKIESNGEKIEINKSQGTSDERFKQLEDLEKGETGKSDTIPEK